MKSATTQTCGPKLTNALMADAIIGHDGGMNCIKRMHFDSEAFRIPYYRVQDLDKELLPIAIGELERRGEPFVADAKLAAEDVESGHLLMRLGFRRVSTQLTLTHSLSETPSPSSAGIDRTLSLDESIIWQHARNFRYDRFSLDPLLPADGRHHLYFNWITNSLTLGKKLIANVDHGFCSFSEGQEGVVVDLLSVLRPRQGIGAKLMYAVIRYAHAQGFKEIRVTTECENRPAWMLYLKLGFRVSHFVSVFHIVRLSSSRET